MWRPDEAAEDNALLEAEKQGKELPGIVVFSRFFACGLAVGSWRNRTPRLSAPCAHGDRENGR
jgi:hypothetical protein